jgi:hypothetical protein
MLQLSANIALIGFKDSDHVVISFILNHIITTPGDYQFQRSVVSITLNKHSSEYKALLKTTQSTQSKDLLGKYVSIAVNRNGPFFKYVGLLSNAECNPFRIEMIQHAPQFVMNNCSIVISKHLEPNLNGPVLSGQRFFLNGKELYNG